MIGLGDGTTVTSQLRHAALGIGRQPRIRYTVTTIDAAISVADLLGDYYTPGGLD